MNWLEGWEALEEESYEIVRLFLQRHKDWSGADINTPDIMAISVFVRPEAWGPWAAGVARSMDDLGTIVSPGPVLDRFRRVCRAHIFAHNSHNGRPGTQRKIDDDAERFVVLFGEVAVPFVLGLLCASAGGNGQSASATAEMLYLQSIGPVRTARQSCLSFFGGGLPAGTLEKQGHKRTTSLLFGKKPSAAVDSSSDDDSDDDDDDDADDQASKTRRPRRKKRPLEGDRNPLARFDKDQDSIDADAESEKKKAADAAAETAKKKAADAKAEADRKKAAAAKVEADKKAATARKPAAAKAEVDKKKAATAKVEADKKKADTKKAAAAKAEADNARLLGAVVRATSARGGKKKPYWRKR